MRGSRLLSRLMRAACPLLGALLLLRPAAGATAAPDTAKVTLHAGTTLATLPTGGWGVNTDVADDALRDAKVPGLLSQAGVGVLCFPGGTTADVYHWRHNTATAGTTPEINPHDTFDAFMGVVRNAGAAALVTVNYGTNLDGTGGGDPAEAAAWVKYANTTQDYGVKYWEIGNEVYGNGEYGSHWETDRHTDHSPAAYGTNALAFITAMKAADPTIKVGVALMAPGQWPDGVRPDWNRAVLAACGAKIDFVSIHWYPQTPGHESDAGLLADTAQIPGMASSLRALIHQYCGANAAHVQIFVTKTASVSYAPGPQTVGLPDALFLSDSVLTWLENGAANVDWWNLHTGPAPVKGGAGYGDFGLLATGKPPEPAADTPFPAYDGLDMVGGLGRAGDRLVSVTSDQPLLSVHAVHRADNSLALLLINKDPARSLAAQVSVTGYTPNSAARVYFYGKGTKEITSAPAKVSRRFQETVPPYSLTMVVLTPPAPKHPRARPRPRAQPRPPRYVIPRRYHAPRLRLRRLPSGIYVIR